MESGYDFSGRFDQHKRTAIVLLKHFLWGELDPEAKFTGRSLSGARRTLKLKVLMCTPTIFVATAKNDGLAVSGLPEFVSIVDAVV
jgi:hypothetical protein